GGETREFSLGAVVSSSDEGTSGIRVCATAFYDGYQSTECDSVGPVAAGCGDDEDCDGPGPTTPAPTTTAPPTTSAPATTTPATPPATTTPVATPTATGPAGTDVPATPAPTATTP